MTKRSVLVQYMADPELQRLCREKFPPQFEPVFIADRTQLAEAIGEAEVVYGFVEPELFARAHRLRWIQSHATGVEKFLYPAMRESEVILTNIRGVLAPPIAEHVMGMLLFLTRRLGIVQDQTREARWQTVPGVELSEETLLLVGLGAIGCEVARRAAGFGMRLIAVDPQPREVPPLVELVRDVAGLPQAVAEARVTICCCPFTGQNRHLISEPVFRAMPAGSYFINVSRGELVDESALAAVLHEGHLAGAALDVTEEEPYPQTGPLWRAPNILISSHSSAYSPRLGRRKLDFLLENLRRFGNGEPLRNVVDKVRGF